MLANNASKDKSDVLLMINFIYWAKKSIAEILSQIVPVKKLFSVA